MQVAELMIERADADVLAPEHLLRHAAADFKRAVTLYFGASQKVTARQFRSVWVRAHAVFHTYSGNGWS